MSNTTATAAVMLQQERERQRLVARISNWIFDTLQQPVPVGLDVRFRYPRCPFCKRRPELVTVKGAELAILSRPGSATVNIPRYRVLSCCSATYVVQHEGTSQGELKRAAYEKRRDFKKRKGT